VTLQDAAGARRTVRARALVNAAGPWVGGVLASISGTRAPAPVRLVKGSHIVVPRIAGQECCYVFQHTDKRILFAIPYEHDFTLIGTTDEDYRGDPAAVRASSAEIDYLCRAASAYFRAPIPPEAVVWTYSGVRPLHDDGSSPAQAATRDYRLDLDGTPPLLTVFGGKITTYRRLAEAALDRLLPHLPPPTGHAPGWTGDAPLPGGDFDDFEATVAAAQARTPFLPPATVRRLVRAYGTRIADVIGSATSMAELGGVVGADLTKAEISYLVRTEWAASADDIVWRRSKLGLRLSPAEIADVDAVLASTSAAPCLSGALACRGR
jgi:glycerol-3-phosphate dehydrogenase